MTNFSTIMKSLLVIPLWMTFLAWSSAQTNDASISEFLEPDNPTNNYSYVQVTLANNGTAPLQKAMIHWKVNGKEQRPYEYVGPMLRPGETIDLYIGGFPFLENATYNFEVYSRNPNGVADDNPSNDQVNYTLKGALELYDLDAGLVRILEPTMPHNVVKLIRVKLKNYGLEPIDKLTINWRVNGVDQRPYEYIGPRLRSREEIDLYIGSYRFDRNKDYTLRVSTAMPNGKTDQLKTNDTATVSF